MWHRFTYEAQVAVVYAQEEATQIEVRPEHLFLGLVRDEGVFSYQLLIEFHCPVGAIKEALRSQLPERTVRRKEEMHLSDEGKRALDLAFIESQSLGHRYIGTEHILLGLMLLDYPLLQEALSPCDISPETLRERIAFHAPPDKNLSIREKFDKFRQFLSRNRR